MTRAVGVVLEAQAALIKAALPATALGAGAYIASRGRMISGVVQAVDRSSVTIVPFGPTDGVVCGDPVFASPAALCLPLGLRALGRAIDAGGAPLDALGEVHGLRQPIARAVVQPNERAPVTEPLWTGIRAIDGLLTIGRGARIGIFGAPGAGKSTLLEMLASGIGADAVVVALIGERGREAAQWMERCDARTTIVCATSDRSAAQRVAAGRAALAQADALRRRGLDVLCIFDSLARYGAALREIAVACGEPAGRGGFPASVFADLAKLVETAGRLPQGSVTLVATVLSDGPDERDPLSEAARSFLDGHIHLRGELAAAGHYPAIDITGSASRTMSAIVDPQHGEAARIVRGAIGLLNESRDARLLGIPVSDPRLLAAVACEAEINGFLRQREICDNPARTLDALVRLADMVEGRTWILPAR